MTDIPSMRPLIGVTTSEVRRGDLATLRRHGEPPQHEMALGLTYMRAIELAGGVPVVLPPLEPARSSTLLDAPRRRLPLRRPGPRPRRLRRARATRRSARPSRRSTASSSSWRAPPTRAGCRCSASAAAPRRSTSRAAARCTSTSTATARASWRRLPTHAVRIAPRSRAAPAARRPRGARSTPSTIRPSTRSATASSPPRGRRTARSRRSRIRGPVPARACSGTPRR